MIALAGGLRAGAGVLLALFLSVPVASAQPAPARSSASGTRPAAAPSAAPAGGEPEVITLEPSPGAIPQAGEPAPAALPAPAQGVDARLILSDLWFKYQALRQRAATREADAIIDVATAFMQREGLRAAPEIASAFMAQGRRALRDGDDTAAAESYRLALRFDPDRPDARFALAGALLRGGHEISGGLQALWQGLAGLAVDPECLFYFGGAALLVVYLGACAGLAAALVLIALRAGRGVAHDIQERMAGRWSEGTAAIAGWTIMAAPLFVPIPFTWSLGVWGALAFAYVRGAERFLIVAALVLLVFVGAFGVAVSWHAGTAADPAARALLQAARAGVDLRQEAALKQAARDHPDDPIYPYLLGIAYRVGGRLDESMAMYQRVLEIEPRNARAMVNLGNLHALRQEFSVAQSLYKKAAGTDPALALAHYDSHLAHLETFNMEAADEELRAARQADDPLVTRLVARASGQGASRRTPVDCLYPAGEMWARALRLRRPAGWRPLLGATFLNPATPGALAGLMAALLVPGLMLAPRSGAAGICRRCGRAFCRRCQMVSKHAGNCSQCVHLFILRDGLAPSVRDRKMNEVVAHHRRVFLRTRILSLVLPGGGHVLGGRPMLGALFLVVWGVACTGLLLRARLLVPPGFLQGTALSIGLVMLILIALAAWLGANLTRQERAVE